MPGPAIDEPIVQGSGTGLGTYRYFHTNHQGSVIGTVGSNGALFEGPYSYDPYGNCYSNASPCQIANGGTSFRFTGRRFDPETGLLYYRARYYSPVIGRFLQTDPVGYSADMNLYTYVGNDPTDKTDPGGANACGSSDDSNCNVTITIRDRSQDDKGNYNDQFTGVKNQQNYNATATVTVNGNKAGTYLIRTLPSDSKKSATLRNGVYHATLTMHHGKYVAIALQPHKGVPTSGGNPSKTGEPWSAAEIQVHRAGVDNFTGIGRNGRAVSEGCLVVCTTEYPSFERVTGMVPDEGSPQRQFTVDMDTLENNRQPGIPY